MLSNCHRQPHKLNFPGLKFSFAVFLVNIFWGTHFQNVRQSSGFGDESIFGKGKPGLMRGTRISGKDVAPGSGTQDFLKKKVVFYCLFVEPPTLSCLPQKNFEYIKCYLVISISHCFLLLLSWSLNHFLFLLQSSSFFVGTSWSPSFLATHFKRFSSPLFHTSGLLYN